MNDEKCEGDSKPTEIAEGLPPVPTTDDDCAESRNHNIRVNEPSAMHVFFVWEKLRLLYNIIVFPFVLMSFSFQSDFLGAIFVCNVFFCTGTVAEGYHCWLGINRKVARGGIFVVWTLITVFWFFSIKKWAAWALIAK